MEEAALDLFFCVFISLEYAFTSTQGTGPPLQSPEQYSSTDKAFCISGFYKWQDEPVRKHQKDDKEQGKEDKEEEISEVFVSAG